MNEFDLIATYLAPLAGEGAFSLTDDAALHADRVITKDLLVDGVHFCTEDSWQAAAQKAVRANVSDIVAMGAVPDGILLGMVWPAKVASYEIEEFCLGLKKDIRAYGLTLLGGDTTRHRREAAPFTISITMTGRPGPRGPVLRSGARPGDVVYVTGTIGDGHLGLLAKLNRWAEYPGAVEAYLKPTPPAALADSIGNHASAAIDISDGLAADAAHVARASGVTLQFKADDIPLSENARFWLGKDGDRRKLFTGGDDYQTLMTVHPDRRRFIEGAAREANIRLTRIGEVIPGGYGVVIEDEKGRPMDLGPAGFSHF